MFLQKISNVGLISYPLAEWQQPTESTYDTTPGMVIDAARITVVFNPCATTSLFIKRNQP